MAGQDIIEVIPRKYRTLLEQSLRGRWQTLQEVRFRIGQAVEWYDGKKHRIDATRVTRMDMKEMMDYMSGYSLYAFEDEIAKGYLTIPGGHRVGVAGQVVVEEGKVKYIQNISFANIRISHEKIGCADKILPYLWKENRIKNTLIIAPPRCGKTTILRDLARKISGEFFASIILWNIRVRRIILELTTSIKCTDMRVFTKQIQARKMKSLWKS